MSGFLANGSSQSAEKTISNNVFFPDITVSAFRKIMRVDQTIDTERVANAIQNAMIAINRELKKWQALQEVDSISEIPSMKYDDKTELELLYQSALFNRAKALLVENYRDFDSTKSGHARADEMDQRIDDHLRRSREAIRALLGIPRSTVELI